MFLSGEPCVQDGQHPGGHAELNEAILTQQGISGGKKRARIKPPNAAEYFALRAQGFHLLIRFDEGVSCCRVFPEFLFPDAAGGEDTDSGDDDALHRSSCLAALYRRKDAGRMSFLNRDCIMSEAILQAFQP